MKRTDEPLDPDIVAQLDAIDATLAGEPVDPQHAELAELALLVAAERSEPEPAFARALDERVNNRFTPPPPVSRRPRRWLGPLAGLTAAAVAALVALVVVSPGGGGTAVPLRTPTTAASGAPGLNQVGPTATSGASAASAAPQPPANGRKILQSAELQLTASPTRIEDVAQQVFDVVGRENGVVKNSTVTAGSGGYAQFQLSIPSGSLGATMTALSNLHYAHVTSRTDATQDVNNAFLSTTRRLADARALRSSLLRQLGRAVTQQQIDSLNGRIHDAENAITRDEAALRTLNNKVNYSQVSVSVNGYMGPVAHDHSSAFTIGQAAHDAGRVLTVAAGVALITLATLVPVLLVGALVAWIAGAVRRRRREHALDLA